ncbi:alpha-L-fucosidase [Cohnella sp. 56]|uniref:alpha-L-fucosidase n=1 Tax=Cohnella sp. 56 TaxID=3113722 RepID=UPI0030EAF144
MNETRIKPTDKQLAYQDWEFGLFVHFGLRTFYEGYEDFDRRPMTPEAFQPARLDCEQWIRTAKQAGMQYAVLTAKHHDGFSNWPSAYTTMSVAQSSWRDGKGDVVREFTDACRKHGVKPGLYYSPYDGSADSFLADGKAYDDYFVNQITELLTGYGDIDVLWFDGCGSENHEYDWPRIIGEIRRLQPNILIFNMGDPDFRWVGNEDGVAPTPCWNVVDSVEFSIMTEKREQLGSRMWLPAECDVQLRSTWFYSDANLHTLKSLDELMGLYDYSVGRGANLLLNVGPDREGLFPQEDAQRLGEFGAGIRRRYADPLATLGDFTHEDGRRWVHRPAAPTLIDQVVVQEDLREGECVTGYRILIVTGKSRQPIVVWEGRNIGHKAICRFPAIRASAVVLEAIASDGEPRLRDIALYYEGGRR